MLILSFILAIVLGVAAGTLTGLFPGIHVNLVAVFLLSASSYLLQYTSMISLVIFIVAMSLTHSFLDFIPSIFLGAPNEDSFLSILPGHELLKKGHGYEAVILTLYGSLIALPIILIFIPIFIFILPAVHELIGSIIAFLLIFFSLYLIFREENFLTSLTIFVLAGFLGFLTLNLPVREPLLPLLTGLFGSSTLIVSLKTSPEKLTKQIIKPLKHIILPKTQIIKSTLTASIAAPLCSFLPGIGSGHAAVIASEISEHNGRSFLFLNGAITTIVTALTFITLYAINRARSGTAVVIKEILQKITFQDLVIIIMAVILSSLISFFLGIWLAKLTAKHINKINYRTLSIITLFILLTVNLFFSNILGIFVLITSTALGIFAIISNSRRINLMGSLLIPTILFYLFQ